jgi:hypothetical protein
VDVPRPSSRTRGPRLALAAFLVLHGVAHLVGAVGAFTAAEEGSSVEYLFGAWTISDPMLLRLVGAAWVAAAVGYAVVAWGIAARTRWGISALVGVTAFSLVLSVAALGAAWIGVLIDVAILVTVAITRGRGATLERA